jgi:ribosomal protein S18 acetylase RimI-like enzyme
MAAKNMTTAVELLNSYEGGDLHDICEACESAIADGGGFGWLTPPPRQVLEAYWKGVLLVPERTLYAARLDGVICGSAQLFRPPANNQAQSFAAQLQSAFIAPWARGHGLAREITLAVEAGAREGGFDVLTLDVRETQDAAITLYESLGFVRWGSNPHYARVDGKYIAGHYYYRDLTAASEPDQAGTAVSGIGGTVPSS